jgi:nucleotide-binding universal stress UspA family protein
MGAGFATLVDVLVVAVRVRQAHGHSRSARMYKRILVAIDLNEESGWRGPLIAAAQQARKFGSEQLIVLTVVHEVEALIYAKVGPLAYEMTARDLENELAARIREVNAYDLHAKLVVTHGASIYEQILEIAQASSI